MKNLGARWNVTDQADGKKVVYINLVNGCSMELGVCPPATTMGLLIEYVLEKGDPGDMIFLNGQFYTQTHKECRA